MKKSFLESALIMAVMSAALVSCSKENVSVSPDEKEPVDVVFNLETGNLTKTTNGNDASISSTAGSIKILVFNESGMLLGYGENEASSSTISMKLVTGDVKCYAVVNSKADLSGISTESDLLDTVSKLSDNSVGSLEMIGHTDVSISPNASVTIPVKRFAAKVEIDKITADFSSPAHAAMEFVVKDIYLVNVAGSISYGMSGSPSVWYNQMKRVPGDADPLISDTGIDAVVTKDKPYATPHYLYCYPNNTISDSNSETWSPRFTRLVVDATLGGTLYYYPVNIPEPESNKLYRITDMTITGPGSESPDVPVEKGAISFTISVTDWATGFTQEIEY